VAPADLANLSREEKLALVARLARDAREKERGGAAPAVSAAEPGDYPLSFAQQRFWFLDQLDPGSYLDNMFRALRLSGVLDRGALGRSLDELVRRHASLRTRFPVEGEEPVQRVERELPGGPLLNVIDLTGLTAEEILPRATALAGEESRRPFDLAPGPLFRATLLRLGAEEHVLLLCHHHIVSDGWSVGLILRDFAALYSAYATGAVPALPELRASYADFARAQRQRLYGEALRQEIAFWRQRLEGAPTVLELPTDHPRRHMASPRGDAVRFEILDPAAARFRALAQGAGATPFMALLLLAGLVTIPNELYEAARVDGATPWQAFRKVILPLAAPGVFTAAILVFIFCWNDFVYAISLTSSDNSRTVPAALAFFTGESTFTEPTGSIAAAAIVVTIPIIVFVLIFQRRIVSGLTAGAVKG